MLHSGTIPKRSKVMSRILKLAALTAGATLLLLLLLLLAAAAIIAVRVDPNDYKDDMIKLVQRRGAGAQVAALRAAVRA